MYSIDLFIQNYFSLIRTDSLIGFMSFVTSLFDISLYFVLIIASICGLIYLFKSFRYVLLFLLTLAFGVVTVYFLKSFFDVSRPLGGVIEVTGQSFPSNHATMATIFFIMLIYIFNDYFKGFGRVIFNFFCIFGLFLVSFSRLYLGVHWFSDVFWGVIIGLIISYISLFIFRGRKNYYSDTSVLK